MMKNNKRDMYVRKHFFFFHNGCKQSSLNITNNTITHNFCFLHHRALPLVTQKQEQELSIS